MLFLFFPMFASSCMTFVPGQLTGATWIIWRVGTLSVSPLRQFPSRPNPDPGPRHLVSIPLTSLYEKRSTHVTMTLVHVPSFETIRFLLADEPATLVLKHGSPPSSHNNSKQKHGLSFSY